MRKIYLDVIIFVVAVAVFLCVVGCNDGGVESGGGDAVAFLYRFNGSANGAVYGVPLIDNRDGKEYRTVIIGDYTWMAENLNYTPETGNSWCYDDNESYCNTYGRLYDWETANTSCPADWSLPNYASWAQLKQEVGGLYGHAKKLKAKSGWISLNYGEKANGTDDFGFSALPGGQRTWDGYYYNVTYYGNWWLYEFYGGTGLTFRLESGNDIGEYTSESSSGLSVRCVKKTS